MSKTLRSPGQQFSQDWNRFFRNGNVESGIAPVQFNREIKERTTGLLSLGQVDERQQGIGTREKVQAQLVWAVVDRFDTAREKVAPLDDSIACRRRVRGARRWGPSSPHHASSPASMMKRSRSSTETVAWTVHDESRPTDNSDPPNPLNRSACLPRQKAVAAHPTAIPSCPAIAPRSDLSRSQDRSENSAMRCR